VAASRSRSAKAAGVMVPCALVSNPKKWRGRGRGEIDSPMIWDDERTWPKREYMSVLADSMPGKRVVSSRATRKGTRRETRDCASDEEESG
jgi:hypothetical protein